MPPTPRQVWRIATAALVLVACAASAFADVVRIEIRRRDDAGSHVRFIGRVFFAIDPLAASSQDIADVRLAPRNPAGLVEFSSDLLIFLPKSATAARGTTFLEVVNRGRDQSLGLLSDAVQQDLSPERWNLGDRFLLKQGFALAFLGWQFDVRPENGLTFQAPIAPVDGVVRATYIGGGKDTTFPVRYCAADPAQADAMLTVRTTVAGPGAPVARAQWSFTRDGCAVHVRAGAPAGLHEVTYRAHGSPVAGLGLAAIRDFASFLKHGGPSSPLGNGAALSARVLGFGYSQSGRFLREFVRDGFNRDTHGRKVFDGLVIASAGAGVGSFNHRFATPGDAGNSVLSILRPVDVPPFTDELLLTRATADDVVPKIFYTLSSTEYWARAASLTHTDDTGTRDVAPASTSRLYFLAGTPHAGGPLPAQRPAIYEHDLNFAEQRWTLRALVLAMDAWIRSNAAPPDSRVPTIAAGTLVAREAVRFPSVRTLLFPSYMPRVWPLDFGPDFAASRVITREPPSVGAPYRVLVPQVDADGNDVGGIAAPEVATPLGTFTGWNVTRPALPQLDYLAGLLGSFEPFARSRRAREQARDSRLSNDERYKGRSDYLARVTRAAQDLVVQGFAIRSDLPAILARAKAVWAAVVEAGVESGAGAAIR